MSGKIKVSIAKVYIFETVIKFCLNDIREKHSNEKVSINLLFSIFYAPDHVSNSKRCETCETLFRGGVFQKLCESFLFKRANRD